MSVGPAADQKAECFMGQYNTSSPNCTAELIQQGANCKCHNLWENSINESVVLDDGGLYRTIQVTPDDWYRPKNTRYLMLLKMPFNYDSVLAQGNGNNYTYPHPSLYLAIFDRSLDLTDAISNNYAEIIDIDALGTSAINLAVVYRKPWRKDPVFSYIPTVNSIPAMNLACDTANDNMNYHEICTTFLYIRIPNTDVTVKQDVRSLTWTDLIQAYGSYFSVIQLLAWLISGAVTASANSGGQGEQSGGGGQTASDHNEAGLVDETAPPKTDVAPSLHSSDGSSSSEVTLTTQANTAPIESVPVPTGGTTELRPSASSARIHATELNNTSRRKDPRTRHTIYGSAA
ncbi:hypothetical protein LTR17_006838 [Elasticomyces elasticus]|nr:hypothetical protein LTR17_006838 [Elasticomyces elasticus]